ncbi:MAG: component of the Tol biopolymer transport system, partial [Chloroflexi bacterium]
MLISRPLRPIVGLTGGLILVAIALAGVAIADNDGGGRLRTGNHAYISVRDGDRDLFVRAAAGGAARQLTEDVALDGDPAWSPDGERIAFSSDRSGNLDIWVIPAA